MNPSRIQPLQHAYQGAQLHALRSGQVPTEVVSPEAHQALNRLLWITGGMLFAAVNTAASIGLLLW